MDRRGTNIANPSTKRSDHHDNNMLKQAVYNTGANVFVVIAGLGIVALYWVLESFFRPLMWAMLCGAFLHPFKYQVTKNIKSWLSGLRESGTPFALGVFKIPIDILDISSENLIQSLQRRWRVIVVVTGVFLALYITYHQAPMDFKQFSGFIWQIFVSVSNFLSFFSFRWVCALVAAYLIAVAKLWSPETKELLGYLSIPIWLLTLFCIIANSGALRLPFAVAIVVLMAVGYYTDSKDQRDRVGADRPTVEADNSLALAEISFLQQWESFANILTSSMRCSTAVEETTSDGSKSTQAEEDEQHNVLLDSSNLQGESSNVEDSKQEAAKKQNQPSKVRCNSGCSHLGDCSCNDDSSASEPKRVIEVTPPQKDEHNRPPFLTKTAADYRQCSSQSSIERKSMRRRSDKCFIFLFWAIALVMLWSNVWLILVPLMSFAFRLLKMLVNWIRWFVTTGYQEHMSDDLEPARVWCVQRLEVVIPMPIRGMIKILLKGDNRVVDILLGSADSFISIMFILLLLVGFVFLSVAVCFQVQKEGIHLVTVTSNLVQNSTLQPQWFTDLLREGGMNETGGGIHSSLDPMIKNLYTFGREWIVSEVSERISHRASRELVQTELVSIWDSLYESWVTKNTTMLAQPNYRGALFSHIREGGVDFMWEDITVDISGIFNFIRENIGIFQSVVESVWILLKGNVNLAFTLVISLLQIILGGSTAILNSFLSLIVFFTTLFYLLASSSDDYKPVEWISKLTIAKTGSIFAQAVEDGIGGVFAATLKMAAFYGIYTWLTHTVFGINIVFLPSVFAAMLGAIPFVGTYWAAIPAILELCLIHKEVFLGVLLAIFHILPIFVVDTALYSDIKGGGHPYLTGLAIAGGIYCFGLQGAIVGPVLLCCIIVAVNLYSATINPGGDQPNTPVPPRTQSLLNLFGESRHNLVRSASTSTNNYEL